MDQYKKLHPGVLSMHYDIMDTIYKDVPLPSIQDSFIKDYVEKINSGVLKKLEELGLPLTEETFNRISEVRNPIAPGAKFWFLDYGKPTTVPLFSIIVKSGDHPIDIF
ncbi:hypothetical protein [Xanthocytophaga agilis]|uniref:Uncharacterized protein n=1 Tax=Xanthocytophaga agilis TaxID=3048010 RepID=A0AAE3R334_9BACT|nr:hypothetical protein [Xanthocytophaga agilis]MDJ1500454.1 hypothetical protein [Xanthocytophaga agilis]